MRVLLTIGIGFIVAGVVFTVAVIGLAVHGVVKDHKRGVRQ